MSDLYLYHGTTSVCAIKVRLALREKALEWKGQVLDLRRGDQHRPEYLKLNPNAVVPTLVHQGRVLIESTLIIEYLDEYFPQPALMPGEPYARAQARLWMKKIDDTLHAACSAVTFAVAFRKELQQKPPAELEAHLARIPNPEYRERQRLSIAEGLAAPHVAQAVRCYDKYIGEMESALAGSPYLVGECYSLADLAATPYVNRAAMLGMDALWGKRPHVGDWLARMRERASFQTAVSNWLTEADRRRFGGPHGEVHGKLAEILQSGNPRP
jgi:glutathione S-transferase